MAYTMSKRTSIRIPDNLHAHLQDRANRERRSVSNLMVNLLWDALGVPSESLPYDPKYGDARLCECGHPYGRHFDGYEDMRAVGCKYCECHVFRPAEVQTTDKTTHIPSSPEQLKRQGS